MYGAFPAPDLHPFKTVMIPITETRYLSERIQVQVQKQGQPAQKQ